MEEQQHNIDEIFRQGLSDYREVPPAAAWDDVERRLDGGERKKPSFRWPWIALLLLLITGAVWYAVQSNHNDEPAKKPIAIKAPESTGIASSDTSLQEEKKSSNSPKQSDTSDNIKETPATSTGATSKGRAINRPAPTGTENKAGKNTASAENRNSYAARSRATSQTRSVASARAKHAGSKRSEKHSSGHKSAANAVNTTAPQPHKQPAVIKNKEAHVETTAENREQEEVANDDKSAISKKGTDKKHSRKAKSEKSLAQQKSTIENEPEPKHTKTVIANTQTSQRESLTAKSPARSSNSAFPKPKRTPKGSAGEGNAGIETEKSNPGSPSTPVKKQTAPAAPALANRSRQPEPSSAIKKIAAPPQEKQSKENNKRPADNIRHAPAINAGNDPEASSDREDSNGGGSTDSGEEEKTKSGRRHRKRLKISAPISLDVLGGYEWGMQKPAPARGVAALRLMVKLSSGFSLGLEPAYRFGNIANQQLSGNQVFGNVSPVQVDSSFTIDTFGRTNRYLIRQSYDSIRVPATSAGGKIWELELPLMLSYQTRTWHIYGGPSFNFGGKIVTSVSGTQQSFAISRRDSITLLNRQLRADTFEHYFGSSTLTPYSSYKPEQAGDPSSLRIGYILGLGYQWKGFLLDASLHQQLGGYINMNATLQKIYGPYIRISLGYRIFGPAQQRKEKTEDDRKSLQRL